MVLLCLLFIGRWAYVFNVYGCASESRHWSIEFNADVDYWRNYHDYYVVLLAYEFAFVRIFSLTIFKGFLCLFDYFCLCLAKTTTDTACKLIIDGFSFFFCLQNNHLSFWDDCSHTWIAHELYTSFAVFFYFFWKIQILYVLFLWKTLNKSIYVLNWGCNWTSNVEKLCHNIVHMILPYRLWHADALYGVW